MDFETNKSSLAEEAPPEGLSMAAQRMTSFFDASVGAMAQHHATALADTVRLAGVAR